MSEASQQPQQPLVSILINAYNSERYLVEAVDSALAQTWRNIEVVIVDDDSKDGTRAIIEHYANRDPRIRYFFEDSNTGIVGSRNRLLKESRGKFLTWLDADDIFLSRHVEAEVDFLNAHSDYDGVYANMKYFFDGEPDKFYRHVFPHYEGNVFEKLLPIMFITNSAFMMRRSVYEKLGGYNPATGMVEDWEYFLRMSHDGMKIGFLEEDVTKYRLRWDSNTNFARQVAVKESQVAVFENLKAHMTITEHAQYHIDFWIAKRKEALMVSLLANGKRREAWKKFWEIQEYVSVAKKLVFLAMFIVPSRLLGFLIEKAWNRKKRSLFVPM